MSTSNIQGITIPNSITSRVNVMERNKLVNQGRGLANQAQALANQRNQMALDYAPRQQELDEAQLKIQANQEIADYLSQIQNPIAAERFWMSLKPLADAGIIEWQPMTGIELMQQYQRAEDPTSNAQLDYFNEMVEGLSPEEVAQAQRIELGLSPRAVGNANITLAGGGAGVTPRQVGQAAGTVAAGEDAGKQAVKMSGDAANQLKLVRSSMSNIDKAIEAIDAGANTGVIYSMLPSVTEASIRLDNVQRMMGLDIIGAVTFGALSEGELNLALQTALPTGLEPPALREWLVEKKAAQQKLAEELRRMAVYLSKPGNFLNDYLEMIGYEEKEKPKGPKVIDVEGLEE